MNPAIGRRYISTMPKAFRMDFRPGDPKAGLAGDTAGAVCPFEVAYRLHGKEHRVKGQDILVFLFAKGSGK